MQSEKRMSAATHGLPCGRGLRLAHRLWLAALVLPVAAAAQDMRIEPHLAASLVWTDNATLGLSNEARSDTILDLRPALRFVSNGAGLRINGSLGFVATTYANGTQPNDVSPQAELLANATLAPRLLFLDASLRSTASTADVFGTRDDALGTANRYTTLQYALSPYLERELTPSLRLSARSDNVWIKTQDLEFRDEDGYFGRHAARIEARPTPLGGALEIERTDTKYDVANDHLTRDLARLFVTGVHDAQYEVSAIVGYENAHFGTGEPDASGTIYGARFGWRPTPRTRLEATAEHRFFGTGWDVVFTHRMPFLAWDIRTQREASSYAERLFTAPAGGDVGALLDAALTTRYPDPAERARVIQEFLARRGLATSLPSALAVFSDRLELFSATSATLSYLGPRATVALTVYRSRTEALPGTDPLLQAFGSIDARQNGATLQWSHRLTPRAALVATASHARIEGLNQTVGESSTQRTYRLEIHRALSLRTTGRIGLRHQDFDSNVNPSGRETAVYASLVHRF